MQCAMCERSMLEEPNLFNESAYSCPGCGFRFLQRADGRREVLAMPVCPGCKEPVVVMMDEKGEFTFQCRRCPVINPGG